MEDIFNEVMKAVGQLLMAGMLVLVYTVAKHLTSEGTGGKAKSVLVGLAACAVIAFIFAAKVGEPTCIDSESDTRGSSCLEYADDGYEATPLQRQKTFAYYLVITSIPALIGINQALKERS